VDPLQCLPIGSRRVRHRAAKVRIEDGLGDASSIDDGSADRPAALWPRHQPEG